ncbi:MAG: B12-binding domain-containing radical SAM protein [Candidatus Omnitrophica bacterium]|nr:B12-binding domain-containing radical SAM protein [Candidatus Omnitrophota bacterium]
MQTYAFFPYRAGFKRPDEIASGIVELKLKYRVDNFRFTDESIDKPVLGAISKKFFDDNISVFWAAQTSARKRLGAEFGLRLKKSGCRELGFTLEAVDKKMPLDVLAGNLKDCCRAGIRCVLLIRCRPFSGLKSLETIKKFVLKHPEMIAGVTFDASECSPDLRDKAAGIEKAILKVLKGASRKKKLLLINPPVVYIGSLHEIIKDKKAVNERPIHRSSTFNLMEPIGLLKLASFYKRSGYDVELIDCVDKTMEDEVAGEKIRTEKPFKYLKCGNFELEKIKKPVFWRGMREKEFKERLKKSRPDEIFITSVFTFDYEPLHRIIRICKEVYPGVPLTLGGIYGTLCPGHAKLSPVDRVWTGLLQEAENQKTAFELLNYNPKRATIKFSRGCLHGCTFCAVPYLEGRRIVNRDYLAVADEIEEKHKRFGVRQVDLWESNILYDSEHRFIKLLDELIKRKLNIELYLPEGVQPSLISEKLARKMKKAGFKKIILAGESSSALVTRKLGKPSTWEEVKKAAGYLKKGGFGGSGDVIIFVMAGMPTQTIDETVKSVCDTWKLGCTVIINPYTPIPQTRDFASHQEFLKNKDLAELHPRLWPFADRKSPVTFLEDILNCEGRSSFFQLRLDKGEIKNTAIIEKMKREFAEDRIKVSKMNLSDIRKKAGFVLIDPEFKPEDMTSGIIKKLYSALVYRRARNMHFYISRPIPPCVLRFGPQWYEYHMPKNCRSCLTENCLFKGKNMSPPEMCLRCRFYRNNECNACFFTA